MFCFDLLVFGFNRPILPWLRSFLDQIEKIFFGLKKNSETKSNFVLVFIFSFNIGEFVLSFQYR